MKKYDFSGWATKANLLCSDGRTIMKDAFKHHDGQVVPLVWNHQHNDPSNVLGHALLENRDGSIYAYCEFNETQNGQDAKRMVEHGDVSALSIWANQLKQQGQNVIHGVIREVSLVLAGANPGAFIDSVISHSDDDSIDSGIIYTGEELEIYHSEENVPDQKTDPNLESVENPNENTEDIAHGDDNPDSEETIADVIDSLSEKQKTVMYALIGQAIEETEAAKSDTQIQHSEGGTEDMHKNLFEGDDQNKENVIAHSDMIAAISDGKRYGTMKESFIQHGITDVEYLFPDAQNMTNTPIFIQRPMGWVSKFMAGVHKSPFSRIKSIFADITGEDARAKGFLKGNMKKDEVFSLLKRTTGPTTIYKKQKMDRDDVIDITDFDVIAWLKTEMRMMLEEEIARAALVGDGRLASSDDKVDEGCIRPIWKDADLYTIEKAVEVLATDSESEVAKAFIKASIKSRKDYKGSGEPTLYTTEDFLTDCLLIEDNTGRIIYDSISKLATTLRVKEIVTVPVMEGLTRTVGSDTLTLMGIIVNPYDYNIGADKGGAVNMFDDFDIDYNTQKYLIETRCSGALTVPYSAIALEKKIVTE